MFNLYDSCLTAILYVSHAHKWLNSRYEDYIGTFYSESTSRLYCYIDFPLERKPFRSIGIMGCFSYNRETVSA